MAPGRVQTSQAAPSTTRIPASVLQNHHELEQAIGGALLRNQRDLSRRTLAGRGDEERRFAARHDVVHPGPLREQAGADIRVEGNAAHGGKIELIAATQARAPGRGILLCREWTLHVVDKPVAVRTQPERSERTNDPQEVRRDHRQGVERQENERRRGRRNWRRSDHPSAKPVRAKTRSLRQPSPAHGGYLRRRSLYISRVAS